MPPTTPSSPDESQNDSNKGEGEVEKLRPLSERLNMDGIDSFLASIVDSYTPPPESDIAAILGAMPGTKLTERVVDLVTDRDRIHEIWRKLVTYVFPSEEAPSIRVTDPASVVVRKDSQTFSYRIVGSAQHLPFARYAIPFPTLKGGQEMDEFDSPIFLLTDIDVKHNQPHGRFLIHNAPSEEALVEANERLRRQPARAGFLYWTILDTYVDFVCRQLEVARPEVVTKVLEDFVAIQPLYSKPIPSDDGSALVWPYMVDVSTVGVARLHLAHQRADRRVFCAVTEFKAA